MIIALTKSSAMDEVDDIKKLLDFLEEEVRDKKTQQRLIGYGMCWTTRASFRIKDLIILKSNIDLMRMQ